MNIVEPFIRQAVDKPDRPAVILGKDTISYGQLLHHVSRLAAGLREAGVEPGHRLTMAVRAPAGHLALTLAAASLGAVSIGAFAGMKREDVEWVSERLNADFVIHDRGDDFRIEYPRCRGLLRLQQLIATAFAPLTIRPAQPEDPWRIMLSSGTTGRPKGIVSSHGAALASAHLQRAIYPTVPKDRLLIGMEVAMGFSTLYWLRALYAGCCAVLLVDGTPAEALRLLHEKGVTQMVTTAGTARALAELAAAPGCPYALPASTVRFIMVGGGTTSVHLREALRRHICPNVFINYGATETGQLAILDADTLDRYPDAAGRLLPWVEAQAMDEQGNPLPAGAAGRLRFRSPCICIGYAETPAPGEEESFRDGWFHSNDVGHTAPDGRVYLSGRTNDVINLSGVKIDPQRVEAVIMQDAAIKECVVVAPPGPLGQPLLVAVIVGDESVDEAALRQRCLELGRSSVPKVIVRATSLPRNDAGKILRAQVRDRIRLEPKTNT